MIYFDTTFLVRLYVDEPGFEQVRSLAEKMEAVGSSIVGKMETESAFHRKFREQAYSQYELSIINEQLVENSSNGLHRWLPLTHGVIQRVHETFLRLPVNVFLRAGDAIHLATAAEAGFKEIYSNDRHLLDAAPLFKLKGINPLAKG